MYSIIYCCNNEKIDSRTIRYIIVNDLPFAQGCAFLDFRNTLRTEKLHAKHYTDYNTNRLIMTPKRKTY